MFPWLGSLCAAALAVGMLCSPTFCRAKPPDLPRDITQQCPEGRDGPHAAGFPERPAPPETPPRQSPLSHWGRGVGGEGYSHDDHPAGAAEEQDAPPERRWFREPTGNRRANLPATPQRRDMDRSVSGDARRLEMLRQTEPLDTQPRRPTVQEGKNRGEELQLVRCEDALPTKSLDADVTRMPYADEAELPSWHAQSTLDNIRKYAEWKNGRSQAATRSPELSAARAIPPLEETLGLKSSAWKIVVPAAEPSHYVEFPWGSWFLRTIYGVKVYDRPEPCPTDNSQLISFDLIEGPTAYSDELCDSFGVVTGYYSSGSIAAVCAEIKEMREAADARKQARRHQLSLIKSSAGIFGELRLSHTLLVERGMRECWREEIGFLIPSNASPSLSVRWLSSDGVIQVHTGSLISRTQLVSPAIMLIIMPTRVEMIQPPPSGNPLLGDGFAVPSIW
jgi:hypothetical protein